MYGGETKNARESAPTHLLLAGRRVATAPSAPATAPATSAEAWRRAVRHHLLALLPGEAGGVHVGRRGGPAGAAGRGWDIGRRLLVVSVASRRLPSSGGDGTRNGERASGGGEGAAGEDGGGEPQGDSTKHVYRCCGRKRVLESTCLVAGPRAATKISVLSTCDDNGRYSPATPARRRGVAPVPGAVVVVGGGGEDRCVR